MLIWTACGSNWFWPGTLFAGVSNKVKQITLTNNIFLHKKICCCCCCCCCFYFLIQFNKMCLSALDILDKLHHLVSLFFSFWIISSAFLNCSWSHFFLKLLYNNFYRWCKYCTPARVCRCMTKCSTLNLVYLIEINLHICILIPTSFGPFLLLLLLLLLLWLLFWNSFWLSLFFERSFMLFRGNFPLYFFN